jgi:hypothetical protein
LAGSFVDASQREINVLLDLYITHSLFVRLVADGGADLI